MTFETKKYQVIKNAVSYELANFIYNYFLLKRDAVRFMYENNIHSQSSILGTWSDEQIPNTYSCYADFVMETFEHWLSVILNASSKNDIDVSAFHQLIMPLPFRTGPGRHLELAFLHLVRVRVVIAGDRLSVLSPPSGPIFTKIDRF